MRRILFSVLLVLLAPAAEAQQAPGPVPGRHIAVARDTDFPGGDIRSIFDSSFEACERACLGDATCVAFTFNTRSGSCFPKSSVAGRLPYRGALSAIVLPSDPAMLARVPQRVEKLGFLGAADLQAARDLAEALPRHHYANGRPAAELTEAAIAARATGDLAGALDFTAAALTLTDSAEGWLDYAGLSLSMGANDAARQEAAARGLSAAVNGFLRAADPQTRANALILMARALEQVARGRDMIPALRLAQRLAPRDDTAAMLDDAIGKFGFRIIGTEVESDSAAPRICATFSEDLVPAGVDYAPYVQLPEPGLAVTRQERRLCIEGVVHGERYRLTFRRGLPAASGETTSRDVTVTQYVRDRAPALRFPGRNYVLPRGGETALPIVTVNVDRVDLALRRVSDRNLLRVMQDGFFGRPLSPWQEQDFTDTLAEQVWQGSATVERDLNREVTTRLPMADVLDDLPVGIYALRASIPGADPYATPPAMQWFIVSDLGLATMGGVDGLHVFVRSLRTAEPKPGITATLLSRSNRVLGTAETDGQGHAVFAPGLTRGTGGAAPALVMVRDGARDIAFLSLTEPAFDLSDRGVAGREPAPPIDMFLTTDRGAYRAGETVHATALARDSDARAIGDLPVTAILTRPDGVEYARAVSPGGVQGGHVFDLDLAASVPRGTWALGLHTDPDAPPLASTRFLVEDFLPERIDFDLGLPDGPLRPTDRPLLSLSARYLFGAPAGDLRVEGEVALELTDTLDAFPGYRFGRFDEQTPRQVNVLPGGIHTDARGDATVPLDFPRIKAPSGPLRATVIARVSEGSGRPVERRLTRILTADRPMIGLKPLFEGVVDEGTEARFELLAIGPDLQPRDMRVRWTLNRIDTRYQWYSQYGNWNWEPVTTRTRIASAEALIPGGRLSVAAPVDGGHYELVVEQVGGAHAAASMDFEAGWYAPAGTADTPDMLEMSLDKAAYAPGDTATLRIVPRYPGRALVTVMSNHLIDMKPVELSAGENTLTLPVTDDWGPGAYVSATLIRPMDVPAGHNPARALGLAHARVDPGPRQLSAAFATPAEADPRGPLPVALKVAGVQPGEPAFATIAAVDIGILNLTGFAAPDPSGHYFGQRKLGMELRDIYGRLIDGMNGAMGQVRSGGDAAARMRMQAPPPTEQLVAFFSGPVQVGADGYARTSFDLPAFNGTIRLMAVVWSQTGVGQAQADILVRDPVVVNASLPRFMAPGDRSRLLLEMTHVTGPAGRMGLDVSADGVTLDRAAVPSGLTLDETGKATLSIPVGADDPGLHRITVTLTTPAGKQLVKTLSLPVQVNDPEVTRTRRLPLAAGDSLALGRDVFAELRPGTGHATLAIGPLARFDAPGLLQALDRYPYGCTEQVASTAMPLLYFDQVARAMGLAEQQEIVARIEQAITRVLTNQSPSGAFGLWQPDSGDFWLDAYVTDFLSRARARGFAVPQTAFRAALDNLRNQVNYAADFDRGGEALAYALMVLAREGAAAIGDLRYYADVKADAFATPLALAQLGAALASYGDQPRADAMFARAVAMSDARLNRGEDPLWRSDYGTDRRDAAGVLALAAEAGSTAAESGGLAEIVAQGRGAASTQEAAWTLLAANALIDRAGGDGFGVNGAPVDGPLVRVIDDRTRAVPMTITNGSGRDTQITLTTFGVPARPGPAGGNGYAIARSYFTMQGARADPATVTAGTRLVTVIEVTPLEPAEARLMIRDPLPAGFEIDNPDLLRGGDIRALDWLDVVEETRNTEFRQDRFLAAVDWREKSAFRLAYIVRAATPGVYHHPAASVEDMYRPDRRAWTGTGRVTVTR